MDSASSGWKGPHWYGGASGGAGYSEATGTSVAGVRQDRWWHALCAWGDDLDDGGEDGQVSFERHASERVVSAYSLLFKGRSNESV